MNLTFSKSALLRLCVLAVSVLLPSQLFGQPSGNVIVGTSTTWPAGTYNLTSLTVQSGAVLTIGGGSTVTTTGAITVTGNSSIVLQSVNNSAQVNGTWQGAGVTLNAASLEVDAGSSINADGQGYVAQAGPGYVAGSGPNGSSAGGSYGGVGGTGDGFAAAAVYGSSTAPTDLGSGGASRCCGATAGSGGGAVILAVSGTLTNNGVISANGSAANAQAGGGAGGTVSVTSATLVGAGIFEANGGGGGEGAGGGGRVAIYYNASSSNFTGFTGSTASGGSCGNNCSNGASSVGSVGTAAFFDTSATNNNLTVYQNFTLPASSSISYNSITVQAGALLTIGGGTTLNIANALTVNGTVVGLSINNAAQVNGNWAGAGIAIKAGSILVAATGSLNVDGQGYTGGNGPGAAASGTSAGGSYGGLGGVGGGFQPSATYGSTTNPTDLGSGGNSRCCGAVAGPGGGALTLTVSGTLTNNGIISANGGPISASVQAGGGSGGTVLIQTTSLAGSGMITSTGGSGNGEAAGGGGRIAIYYSANTGFNLTQATANGGTTTNGNAGAVGTVYSLAGGSNLTVSNNTVLPANSNLTFASVTVNNQATLTLGSGTTLAANSITVSAAGALTVGGGSTLNVSGALLVTGQSNVVFQSINNSAQVNGSWQGTGVTLNAGSVQVDNGSTINADAQGYVAQAGPGYVPNSGPNGSSAGGSYGGAGGTGDGVAASAVYGSTIAPTDLGSGGAERCCGALAGTGGGAIRMVVTGTLTNNGIISANGGAPVGGQAGGGSAGSIYVTTSGLVGTGIFSAVGGLGGEAAGGGGRIAIYYNGSTSSFTGFSTSTAAGGLCGNNCSNGTSSNGSVGTVAFYDTSAKNNNVSIYQNQTIPAGSVLTYNSLTVQSGALLTIGGGSTINVTGALTVSGTLVAQSINNTAQVNNAWVGQGVTFNAGSITVNSGGSLNSDGQGYVAQAGPGYVPGSGPNGSSAGGSYGGVGGTGDGFTGAAIYGSTTAPSDLGSGGGERCCGAIAGAGGGDLRLVVSGTLTNNGIISSNGGTISSSGQAGGGSGGALYVTTSALMGAGAFEANGGPGGEAGGGGGRVAVYYNGTVSQFTGYAASTATGGGCANNCTNGTSSAGGNGTAAFYDTSATNSNLNVYQDQTIPAGSVVNYNSITVQAGSVLTIGGGSIVNVAGSFTVSGTVIAQSINNTAQVNGTWQGSGVAINAAALVVNTGASLNADGQGYVGGVGPGSGLNAAATGSSAGGSYGGVGGVGDGVSGPAVYGSSTLPTGLGSGGSSRCCNAQPGAGGGNLTLTISGTLTNNGNISANGAADTYSVQGGGGSGGTLMVTTNGLSGSGVLLANGGAGGEAGGGGGRIAIYYNGPASNFSGFPTSTASPGGCGSNCSNGTSSAGGNGTAAFFDTSVANNNLSVYQNFTIPASTSVNYNNITLQPGGLITIGGGTSVTVANTLSVAGTVVAQAINNTAQVNGSWVGSGVTLNAATLQVAATGSINADLQGYVASAGPGYIAGAGPNGSSAGGSYGGVGGTGDGFVAAPAYGSPTAPTDLGSGGTSRCCSAAPGSGGGAIAINVTGTLTDNGIISANGGAVNGMQAGGGSGGSLNIHTGTIAGSGTIAANGGSGNGEAGGAGGRVALYFNTNSGFDLTLATAGGAATTNGNAGGAGTVYTLAAGTNLTVAQNTVLPPNATLNYSTVTINNGGTFTLGTGSTLTAGSINVAAAGTFTIGGGSTVNDNGTLVVTGNSNIIAQSLNNSGAVNGSYAGTGVTIIAASAQIDAGSSINADTQGYMAGVGPGAGPSGSSDGGSYGGLGGNGSGVTPGPTYGSATAPMDLGSGGNSRCCGAPAGSGGGAIRLIVGGTLTDNGVISANGSAGVSQAGGGSGGSVFVVTNTLAGSGSIAANGGAGGEAGGGGGRIALYYLANSNFNPASIVAAGGQNGVVGAAGTVDVINAPTSVFLLPTAPVVHGTAATLQWFTNVGGPSTVTLAGPQTATLATGSTGLTTATFDTTQFPDGSYQLVLTVLNNAGQAGQTVTRDVVINNSVAWHSGTLATSQTWSGPQVQALDGQVIVPAGVTLTILPGTIVKALPGAEIIVQSGGTLIANGATGAQVIFTTFDDYTAGGNTDFNQGISVPSPGEWNGIAALSGGTFTENSNTILRYVATTLSGSLSGSTTLYATQVYSITGTLAVPSGVTLTIQPGAIIKFGPGAGMDVQPGATLIANGTLAQPIYFTSYNDISIGGDTNNTNGAIAPAPGDWNSVILDGAIVSLQHVQMQYGGGPLNTGNQAGMLETTDNANVTISDSIFANSYTIGIQTGYPNGGGDTVTVTGSIFYGNEDRAINAYPGSTVHVVNDTFDANAYGPFAHGGVMDVENSVISNSIGTQFGSVEVCCGSTFAAYSNNDVYTTAKGVTNYVGLADPTGTQGNISANPVYMNQALHDYRPTYGSPLIDAANGTVPNYPLTDNFGLPRYNAPLVTTKTGTPDVNGNYPDIGAFEFVQSAPSNLDFTVSNVQGPATATVGTQVQVSWTVTNIGSGTAYGPWHDAVYLITDPNTNPVETLAGTALEGAGIVLGPGATYNATATITVPGVTAGPHRWEVKTNVLGEIFEGANTANNTGIALNEVNTDLNQLVAGAGALSGSFSGIGQSAYYKVVPSATQTTQVQLALVAVGTGSVQLFVGAGYVPSPQHYDFQQTQFDSSTASVIIPSGSMQTYYVTAYAQNLTSIPAAFTIQSSTVSFSLTSVSPVNTVQYGTATLTFTGGGFTSGTTFVLLGKNGATYNSTATFLADSAHADVTFNVASIPLGTYTAEAINGGTVTLANAENIVANPNIFASPSSFLQITLETPEAFRSGFPSVITLHYTNVSNDDIPAPIIYVNAGNATLAEVPPPCTGCDTNFQLQYGNTFNSGTVLGINQQGPAGILPSGASGSIQFYATPTSSGDASFYASANTIDLIGTKLQFTTQPEICGEYQNQEICPYFTYQSGGYTSATNFCSSLTPPGDSVEGFSRACMLLLNNAGYTYTPTGNVTTSTGGSISGPVSLLGTNAYAHVTAANFNALLASDATALSAQGDYEYDLQKILAYELNKDGLPYFNQRYHTGAFGFGPSEPFDITLTGAAGSLVEHLPNGSNRTFSTASPTQPNVYLGGVSDYGTATLETDGSWLVTESDGTLYHFIATAASGATQVLDYIQGSNGYKVQVSYNGALVGGVSDGFGNSLSFQYDSLGHITQSSDAQGRTATFGYTILNDTQHSTFLTSINLPTGTTTLTWTQGGSSGVGYFADTCIATYCEPAINVSSIAFPDGSHNFYYYDSAGRMTEQTKDGGAQAIFYTYNGDGSITTTDALGNNSKVSLNSAGFPLSVIDPLGNVQHLRYDPENKLTGVTGGLGDSTFLTYDNSGDGASVTLPLGNLTSLAYAGQENPSFLTDPLGNVTGFGYDTNFDQTSQTDPTGKQTTYTFDKNGNPLTRTNRRGQTTTYTYGSNGLIATKTLYTGALTTYAYDNHNNLHSITTAAGATSYTYDTADRLVNVTNPDGTSVSYTYNSGNQKTGMTDSTGYAVSYTYDAAGRLSGVNSSTGASLVAYTYDADGRLLTKTMGNGTSTAYTYNSDDYTSSVINYSPAKAVLSEYDYTYDANHNPVTEKTPTGTLTYTYDLNGELTNIAMPGGSIQYLYDADGNRTSVTSNGAVSTYLPNNLNEYQSVNGSAYTYDADGNMTGGNGYTYTYNEDNKVLTMVSATDSWSYTYDGLGFRVGSVHNGVATRYLNDLSGYGNLAAELSGTGALQTHFTYGLDLTSATPAGSSASYYHFDGTGNTTQMTNASGAVVNSYVYLPFGEKTTVASSIANPFTYAGQNGIVDDGAGLYFMRNRWYNPILGRFQQPDPTGLDPDVNLYRYVDNAPVEYSDPIGTYSLDDLSNSTGSRAFNATSPFVQGAAPTLAAGIVGQVSNTYSLTQSIKNGDTLGIIHDGTLYVAGLASTFVPDGPLPPTPLGVLQGVVKYAGTIDEGSKVVFNTFFLNYYNPPSPLTNPCGNCITLPNGLVKIPVNAPKDPNGKLTSGYGENGYVPAGTPIIYTVFFENQPTATLSAQKVTVTDPLPSNLDPSTVQFNQIAFNNVTLNVASGTQTYTAQTNVSTDPNPVAVSASVNPATGVLTWTMQSVDPVTGSTPANPLSGFLPPNNAANAGSGYVTFSVMPKAGLANGATITNQASIVFDVNAAIATNTVTNTIDASTVTSSVTALPASTTTPYFPVSWSGSDASGSGVAYYNIYVSIDGGAYSLWLSATTLTTSTYTGTTGHSYTFYSIATNNVGIVQSVPISPQTIAVNQGVPLVTVTPASSSIVATQSLGVTVAVASPTSGGTLPTGNVTLSSGSYTSATTTLSSGSASFTIPAGALAAGTDTLTATYLPDANTAAIYTLATGAAQVTVGGVATGPLAVLSPAGGLTFTATSGTTSAAQTVQLTNNGNAPLTITGVTITGTGAASFADTSACGNSLAAGFSCNISVTFTPSSVASFSAALSVADNASGSPQTVALTGTGTAVPAPIASVTPTSLTFTATNGTTSAIQSAQLSNTGNAALAISGITLTGTGAGSFAQTNACGNSLAAGANCLISITFTPSSVASFSATLAIADNASGTPQTVALTGTGTAVPAPIASVTPTSLTFTATNGTTSAIQSAQLSNTGNAALAISGITLTGIGAGSFAQTNACGNSLAAGANCLISITFTPSSVASFSAALAIADNASGTPQTVTLAGTGTAVPAPIASVTPTSLTFTATSGTTSAIQTAQLSNTGTAALTISGITLTGTGAGSFAQTNACGNSLAAGANCLISITFTPSSAASFSATLAIADNASGTPQTVTLAGTGTAPLVPVASLSTSALSFTSMAGTPSAVQTAKLSNTGTGALTISGITISGTGAADFAQTNTCGTSLAAGANCTISLTFTPAAAAAYTASLSIADNASGSPQTIALTGTGTAIPAPVVSVTPAALTFTAANGIASAVQTAQLSNTGNAPLTISGITLTGTGAAAFAQTNTCGTSLAAGANCLISVTFTPTSIAGFSASVSIADNATGSPQTIALTGTGTATPTFQLSATPATQTVVPGGSTAFTIAVTPQGGAFTSPVVLTASGLPSGATASFAPASVTPGSSAATSTLTVQTVVSVGAVRMLEGSRPLLALVGLIFVVTRKRRRLALLSVILLASLAGMASLTGCGYTPKTATYNITVTGTSGSNVQTTTVTLVLHQ